ncbi:MAG: hypothetical protein HFJ04_09815 [Lachnospiraceae bacterium]|nr:hypothetical protein [Lachnospiraceae bacterium]
MHVKTMEGLVGARTNMNLLNTPMRVFKEARRKGDLATMERAMGYVGEFADKTEEYKAEADKGMEEDAKEAKEKAKELCEEAIQTRREEREKLEARIEENGSLSASVDIIDLSEEGKVLSDDRIELDHTGLDESKADTVKTPVTYTKTGQALPIEPSVSISVSV